MGIRIQPREIDVSQNDPFENDLLGRKEPVEVLTHLVGDLDGPCVLAVDAAWGSGKTTFLRIWAQYLRNQEFPVVEFNAWETDFSGDPFVTLSTELTEGLHEYADEPLAKKKIDATKKVAKEVLRRAVPSVIRVASVGILDVSPLLEKEVGQALASYAKDRLSEYQEVQKAVRKFRGTLQDMARELSAQKKGHPLIVMIDELDRCRPSYAVELLEVAKHLFSVDHIVFVLAVNRFELAHSIKALYGSGFDAAGYLRRFFDVDFRLPDPERTAFIDAMLDAIQINKYIERTKDQSAKENAGVFKTLLHGFFAASDLSLRRIEQAIHRLGLVFASLRDDRFSFLLGTTTLLIVRTIEPEIYHQFVNGKVSDLEVIKKVLVHYNAEALQENRGKAWFEASIITAAAEGLTIHHQQTPNSSSLLQQYEDTLVDKSEDSSSAADRQHAQDVVELVKFFSQQRGYNRSPLEFRNAVRRLELLSADLIDAPDLPPRTSPPSKLDPGPFEVHSKG